ncbi:MAG: hypothetical protein R3D25_17810 [Geminicoccaceae bacterium]
MFTPNSTGREQFWLRRTIFAALVLTAASAIEPFAWLVGRMTSMSSTG